MSLAPVLRLLEDRTGMRADALGSHSVEAAVAARLAALRLGPAEYALRLGNDAEELQALVDAVVVPETWFFRGGQLFYYLAERARLALRDRPQGQTYRALSLPCSTGEEPYSLAIALCELGVPADRCHIDGVDVSQRNTLLAQQATYGELSFRQTEPVLRQRYFRQTVTGGWQLVPEVRRMVHLRTGNLLDPGLLLLERPYDLIFCRNVFIYFGPDARHEALATVLRLLAPGGLLCLGHADPIGPADLNINLERTGPDGYFLLRRPEAAAPQAPRPSSPTLARVPARNGVKPPPARPAAPAPPPPPSRPLAVVPPPVAPNGEQRSLLDQARQSADAGRLNEALERVRSAERRFGPSADTMVLLGVIQQASGQAGEAMRSYQKALYLSPDHADALTHLMLLCVQQGQPARAELLRRRLERLDAPPPPTPPPPPAPGGRRG